ncbi:glycosyltransferase [Methanofollis fontis]|uniref:Glycosyl transferase family 1 domain-containing protein n=1 Tax=Methanofollis fontis TaxID=2052832 RepID=A0A483CUB4_9EURY|nr:glycosyltransferase [Methanofollis fontis]TAJ45176.1 hypothetical protein CUJ86_00010 [Methanofollis fontis]
MVKISLLASDFSKNGITRVLFLGKMLRKRYRVEVVGPASDGSIWGPLASEKDLECTILPVKGHFRSSTHMRELAGMIDGDVVYPVKPLSSSFGVGLFRKLAARNPLILDIDDWDRGLYLEDLKAKSRSALMMSLAHSTLHPFDPCSFWGTLFFERLIPYTDEITVSSHFLQNRFGGTIVWHARSAEMFDPGVYDRSLLRGKYAIDDGKRVVMFMGTPRPHKGLEDLIEAVRLNGSDDIICMVVGMDDSEYCRDLVACGKKHLGSCFQSYGLQPFSNVPEFLALSDLVVIPQRRGPATVGQVPAKLFDAMAMARPIIATDVSDLSRILDGCGWIVEPDAPDQIAEKIASILHHPEEAEAIGRHARQRFLSSYSEGAVEKTLFKVFRQFE